MDAMCVADILLEGAAVRLHPWSNDIRGENRRFGGGICAVEETATGESAVGIEILADNLALVITD
jgi:hypothetical protein